jgi:hypothetical protein
MAERFVSLLFFFIATMAAAADNSANADTNSNEDTRRPTVELVVLNSSASATSSIDFEVSVSNPTSLAYVVDQVLIYFPGALVETRRSAMVTPKAESGAILTSDGTFDLRITADTLLAGSIRVYRGTFPAYDRSVAAAVFDRSTFLFVPGDFPVRATVKVSLADQPVTHYPWAKATVHLQAPLSASLRGGLLGAILLALFVPAYELLQLRGRIGIEPIHALRQFFVFALSGCVVATAGILVIYRLGSSDFPITIQITDWLGGFVVGLFSYPIGKKLHSMLFPDDTSGSDPKGDGGSS